MAIFDGSSIVYNPKMAALIFVAKHQLSLFSQYWLFESYWPPKRELKKTCLRQKMGCSTRICYLVFCPPFLVLGANFWYVEVKKWPTITWLDAGFLDFLEPWITKMMFFWLFFDYISKQQLLETLSLLKIVACVIA